MSAFPDKARVVIVGLGGIVGASIAHHLIARGWDDIVGIDHVPVPGDFARLRGVRRHGGRPTSIQVNRCAVRLRRRLLHRESARRATAT